MKFVFFTPTLNRFAECNNLLRSVYANTLQPEHVIVLDNSAGQYVPDEDIDKSNLEIHIPHENIGVARAFNFALYYTDKMYPDHHLIISNDDLVLYEDTLEKLADGIKDNPDQLVYCSDLNAANSFSFFCVKPRFVIDTVGYFETAYHSYLEDCDFMHRARMLGYELFPVPNCKVRDHVGSGTLKAFSEDELQAFHNRRARGIDEYKRKWGRLPEEGKELYTTPYNSGIDAVAWHRYKFSQIGPF